MRMGDTAADGKSRRSGPHTVGRVDMPQSAPDGAVALEARAEGNLPDPVAALHPDLCLDVGQYVPAGHRLPNQIHSMQHRSVVSGAGVVERPQ